MKNIFVLLISDQTIPNILFVEEMKKQNINPNEFIFITTNEMERKGKSKHIIKTLGISEEIVRKLFVDEYNLLGIENTLEQEIRRDERVKYILNFVGGTKIMAMAAYKRFENIRADIYYTDKNSINIKVFPTFETKEISVFLSIEKYLSGYGLKKSYVSNQKKDRETAIKMFNWYLENEENNDFRKVLNFIRQKRGDNRINLNELKEERNEINNFLEKLPFKLKNNDVLEKDEIKYITGDWFEEFIYYWIKDVKKLEDDYIKNGIVIEREVYNNERTEDINVRNEYDVIYMEENKLNIIECKTSIKTDDDKEIFNETAYKISALKKDFGLTVRTSIYILDNLRDESGKIKDKFDKRSKALDLQLKDKIDILNESEIWRKSFKL